MEFSRTTKPRRGINIVSLIDVLFFLAIFLMLCTTFVKKEAIDVSMGNRLDGTEPMTSISGAIDKQEENTMRLSVSAKSISLDNVRYSREDLAAVMKEKLKQDSGRQIKVITEEGATVQNLIDVIDIVRLQGGTNVTINHY